MEKITDVNVDSYTPVLAPDTLIGELPLSTSAMETVGHSRKIIRDILDKKDSRLIVITGPCSIHDKKSALDYAER